MARSLAFPCTNLPTNLPDNFETPPKHIPTPFPKPLKHVPEASKPNPPNLPTIRRNPPKRSHPCRQID